MNRYKIVVGNEEENKKVQDLFFELGCYWYGCDDDRAKVVLGSSYPYPRFIQNNEFGRLYYCESHHSGEEINLPKLRDLVVLKRNDVNDATHLGKSGSQYYLGVKSYFWDGVKWEQRDFLDLHTLKPIESEDTQQEGQPVSELIMNANDEVKLISCKEALIALANGEEVLWRTKTNAEVKSMLKDTPSLEVALSDNCNYRFWVKPKTITINGIEVPAPFKPKEGEECKAYYIDGGNDCGYDWMHSVNCTDKHIVWRTEGEIKKVVAAQHKIFGDVK